MSPRFALRRAVVVASASALLLGTALVSGKLLNEIVGRLPNQPVNFEVGENKAVITCGTSKFELAILPIAQYPTLPPVPPVTGTIDGESFIAAIRRVSVASAKDSTRPFQKGIQIVFDWYKSQVI